jgi:hypothetical protein
MKRCTALLQWGNAYTKYHCQKPATHWHPELGELCKTCAADARAEGLKRIKPLPRKGDALAKGK